MYYVRFCVYPFVLIAYLRAMEFLARTSEVKSEGVVVFMVLVNVLPNFSRLDSVGSFALNDNTAEGSGLPWLRALSYAAVALCLVATAVDSDGDAMALLRAAVAEDYRPYGGQQLPWAATLLRATAYCGRWPCWCAAAAAIDSGSGVTGASQR